MSTLTHSHSQQWPTQPTDGMPISNSYSMKTSHNIALFFQHTTIFHGVLCSLNIALCKRIHTVCVCISMHVLHPHNGRIVNGQFIVNEYNKYCAIVQLWIGYEGCAARFCFFIQQRERERVAFVRPFVNNHLDNKMYP